MIYLSKGEKLSVVEQIAAIGPDTKIDKAVLEPPESSELSCLTFLSTLGISRKKINACSR